LERETALGIIEKLKGRRILVAGDVMLDRYLWGVVSRISPEAPVPVVDVRSETYRLGGAANVARNVLSVDAVPVLVGVVGPDEAAGKLAAEMGEAGVGHEGLVVDESRKTTVKTRIVAHDQQVVRADEETRHELSGEPLDRMRGAIAEKIASCDGVIISDYAKGALPQIVVEETIAKARSTGIPVCVDPQDSRMDFYRGATVITPNSKQAAAGFGAIAIDDGNIQEVGRGLLKRLACDGVLITRGSKGMALFEASGAETHLEALAKKVYDVTGAGDTVVSVFAAALAAGAKLADAAYLSNHAAGIVVGELGTACVTREELAASLNG
jgi:D-beta-D-heptose 7-phosphate kinase/D-beta-D-heptose 1-phosphate adenosyltransferase